MTFPNYDAIKGWFNLKLWTPDMVAKAVELKVITADQYKAIVGENYQAPVASVAPAASTAPVGTLTVASDSTAASGTANVTPTV